MQQKNLKRIMIFGRPGSGKSTFAVWLSHALCLPLYHLDKYFFMARWVERDYDDFLKIQHQIVEKNAWIIDGNSTRSLEARWKNAELALYFNFPKTLCYLRLLKRFLRPNSAISDRAPDCPEVIRFSLLTYTWHFEKRVSEKISHLRRKYPNILFIEIKNDQDLKKFKNTLMTGKTPC